MKIRNGFVSNSSSSSFVVAFPRKPETVEEIYNLLFGKGFLLKEPYGMKGVTVEDICKRIYEDTRVESANDKELLEYFKDNLYKRFKLEPERLDNNEVWRNYCGINSGLYLDACLASSAFDRIMDELNEKVEPYLDAHYKRIRENPDQEEESYKIYEDEVKADNEIIELDKKYTKAKRKCTITMNKCAKADLDFFNKDNFGAYILVKEYGNYNGPTEMVIEDSAVFRKLPYLVMSNH
jgi:hypothetical protein